MNCLNKVRDALLTVSENVGHFEALRQTDAYIVWGEDGEGAELAADNLKQAAAITGNIHLYTRDEDAPEIDGIPAALKAGKISFKLADVSYEDASKYIHYRWDFEVG